MKLWIKNNNESEWQSFLNEMPSTDIEIARCISVSSPSDIDLDYMGRHWTTKNRWSAYGKNILSKFPNGLYCIFGKTDKSNIEWDMSKEMFTQFDDEYELYVIDLDKITDIKVYEVNSDCTLGKEVTDEII